MSRRKIFFQPFLCTAFSSSNCGNYSLWSHIDQSSQKLSAQVSPTWLLFPRSCKFVITCTEGTCPNSFEYTDGKKMTSRIFLLWVFLFVWFFLTWSVQMIFQKTWSSKQNVYWQKKTNKSCFWLQKKKKKKNDVWWSPKMWQYSFSIQTLYSFSFRCDRETCVIFFNLCTWICTCAFCPSGHFRG